MLRCDSTTPLGRPVLPEVYRMASMSVSMTRWPARAGAASNSAHGVVGSASGAVGVPASVSTTWRSAGHCASTGASSASRSGEVTSTRTSQSCRM